MYKIISKVLGSVKVNNKDLGMGGFIIVDKINEKITELQQEGIIKVKVINDNIKKDLSSPTILVNPTIDNSNNKKNKKTSGGN